MRDSKLIATRHTFPAFVPQDVKLTFFPLFLFLSSFANLHQRARAIHYVEARHSAFSSRKVRRPCPATCKSGCCRMQIDRFVVLGVPGDYCASSINLRRISTWCCRELARNPGDGTLSWTSGIARIPSITPSAVREFARESIFPSLFPSHTLSLFLSRVVPRLVPAASNYSRVSPSRETADKLV